MSSALSRRAVLRGGFGLAAVGALSACGAAAVGRDSGGAATAGSAFGGSTRTPLSAAAPVAGQRVVTAALTPGPAWVDLGGIAVDTWAYGATVPGKAIRASAGDFLKVTVANRLPADTTVHWHGIRLDNAADGVPGMTQDPIAPGAAFDYGFTVPDPGTYFFHPHVGVQLDRGLYGPLIVDDPHEPSRYDDEWVIVLDDWIDGTGTTPDEVLRKLTGGSDATGGGGGPMGGAMDHGSMGMGSGDLGDMASGGMGGMIGAPPWGDAGDITYPHFLINGKTPTDSVVFSGKPGQRIRIRLISAASDTVFAVYLGGHRMTVTHTDGWATKPTDTEALYVGMGERYDVLVTLGDGAFPLVAIPFGKSGQAREIVRTSPGAAAPTLDSAIPSPRDVLIGSRLAPAPETVLAARAPDAVADLVLTGSMRPYVWRINCAVYGKNEPIAVDAGQRLRIQIVNMSMMAHPIHLHGHTFALADTGLRKDTVMLAPMETRAIDLDADNRGDWALHCHNIYHAEAGMMTELRYTA